MKTAKPNPVDYKHPLIHEVYLALNVLYEEAMDRINIMNLKQDRRNSLKFAQRVLQRYRVERPQQQKQDEQIQERYNQIMVEITKAIYLCEAPHWHATRRWDVAMLLASAQNIMRELERELHARSKQGRST